MTDLAGAPPSPHTGGGTSSRVRWTPLGWLTVVIAAVFFGYDAFEGLSNLVGAASSVIAPYLPPTVWIVVGLSAAVPVLLFIGSLVVSWRMSVKRKVLVFLVGLAVSAALALTFERLFVVLVLGG